jgi:NAD(P)-dependent dehydrogenase (short-subunit alcohol dehydrogenase family)
MDGFHVIVNGVAKDDPVSGEGAYEVKKSIEDAGGSADVFRADVASREDREATVDYIDTTYGRLDLLVNNAGVAPSKRMDVLEATEESYDRVMGINLKGPYFLTQLVANRMIQWKEAGVVKEPRIAFIGSISAYAISPARGEYCISKAGLSMASQLFAVRLGEYGIPVIDIAPGIIESDMTSTVKAKYDKLIAEGLLVTKRWGQPDDIAKAVSAFAAGHFDYSTGERIEVGGGFGLIRL